MVDHPNLSRRAALTGAMAVLSTAPAAAAAVPSGDDREEWLALYHAFCKAELAFNEASGAVDASVSLDEIWAMPEADAYSAAKDALTQKPSDNIIGVAMKLALLVHFDCHPADDQMVVSAWRDAIHLAGFPEGLGTTAYRESVLISGGSNG